MGLAILGSSSENMEKIYKKAFYFQYTMYYYDYVTPLESVNKNDLEIQVLSFLLYIVKTTLFTCK